VINEDNRYNFVLLLIVTGLGIYGLVSVLASNVDSRTTSVFIEDGGFINQTGQDKIKDSVVEDEGKIQIKKKDLPKFSQIIYKLSGKLVDVSGGNSSGTVLITMHRQKFRLRAVFNSLPKPKEGFFYTGWIVRQGDDFSVINTGRLSRTNGKLSNHYTSKIDRLDHDFYILTVQEEGMDLIPDLHILEGTAN